MVVRIDGDLFDSGGLGRGVRHECPLVTPDIEHLCRMEAKDVVDEGIKR